MNDPEYAQQMANKNNNLTEKKKTEMVNSKLSQMNSQHKTPEEVEIGHQEFEDNLKNLQTAKKTIDINKFVSDQKVRITNIWLELLRNKFHSNITF